MTQVLDRETLPTVVEESARPEVHEPQPPPPPRFGPVRWLAWIVGIVGVVVVGVIAFTMLGEGSDGSWEAAESEQMTAMAPSGVVYDASFDVSELARMMAMAPQPGDQSWEIAEQIRMMTLAPDIDDSFERNEIERMQRLNEG